MAILSYLPSVALDYFAPGGCGLDTGFYIYTVHCRDSDGFSFQLFHNLIGTVAEIIFDAFVSILTRLTIILTNVIRQVENMINSIEKCFVTLANVLY